MTYLNLEQMVSTMQGNVRALYKAHGWTLPEDNTIDVEFSDPDAPICPRVGSDTVSAPANKKSRPAS
jgi:hypothetical protein